MTLMEQTPIEWRKIPYAPDRYEVSNTGMVRVLDSTITVESKDGLLSTRLIEGRYLNPYTRANGKSKGHPVVSLRPLKGDDRNLGETRVSLLVARAFHGSPYDPTDAKQRQRWRIRHIDGDITNNSADNLEWYGNGGSTGEGEELYAYNMRRWKEMCEEPVEDWIRRIWGDDVDLSEIAS